MGARICTNLPVPLPRPTEVRSPGLSGEGETGRGRGRAEQKEDHGREKEGAGGPISNPVWGMNWLVDLGWIQTPFSSLVSIPRNPWICISNFIGANPSSPVGVAAV